MRSILFAILLMSWIAGGCGNKRVISKRASKSVASKNYTNSKTSESIDNNSLAETENYIDNSQYTENETIADNYPEEGRTTGYVRSGTSFGGASGMGTGGSYASNYYGSQSAKNKKKASAGDDKVVSQQEMQPDNNIQEPDTWQEEYPEDPIESDSAYLHSQELENLDEVSAPQNEDNWDEDNSW
ncbi:MAG TPA: hypothetical protein VIK89_14320 [Cytophagaceae bacterium]